MRILGVSEYVKKSMWSSQHFISWTVADKSGGRDRLLWKQGSLLYPHTSYQSPQYLPFSAEVGEFLSLPALPQKPTTYIFFTDVLQRKVSTQGQLWISRVELKLIYLSFLFFRASFIPDRFLFEANDTSPLLHMCGM